MEQIFLGQNGLKILNGVPDPFGKHFDWQLTTRGIHGSTTTPRTIYIKTDFLPFFVDRILPSITNEFILISGASDYTPEINFNREYMILKNHPNLKFWFMNNMKTKEEKLFSLPAGLAAGQFWGGCSEKDVDELLIGIRNSTKNSEKKEKVFCCFRVKDRNWNVCGDDMIIRPKIYEIIKGRTDIFDFYDEDSMDFKKFVETISQYKFSLCPHGNGMDPNPNAWLSLIVKTTPVIFKTDNAVSMFEDVDSVIFFDSFEQLLDENLYKTKEEVNFDFLTNQYWANKIKNKFTS